MILEEETFIKFGYYPKDLKLHSKKKILAACDDCGKVRVIAKQDYSSLCKSCVKKGEKTSNWKGGPVKRICETCGNEFEVFICRIKEGKGRFCSIKCFSEWQSKHYRGENSPRWLGGISFAPYCEKFDFAFKEYIREKFGRVCFLCQKTEAKNRRKLDVHHVNYDKECLCNDNLTCQFVPLCRSCNSKVNGNREEWEKKIRDMMRNKLNGWYI